MKNNMDRKEALEKIRVIKNHYIDIDTIEAFETLIPELAESEDESIRKALMNILYYVHPSVLARCGVDVKKAIAYLERQKGQKLADLSEMMVHKEPYIAPVPTSMVADEQKPAECLKAERDGWYMCIKDYYRGGKKQCSIGDLVQAKGGMYMMGEEDISEWFRKAYYEEVRSAFKPNTDTNIPDLPPEWTEEDEKMAKFYDDDYNNRIGNMPMKEVVEMRLKFKDWIINRIKHIRPPYKEQWRPSEEQLNAVRWLLDEYRPWLISSADARKKLRSLLNDLEKNYGL